MQAAVSSGELGLELKAEEIFGFGRVGKLTNSFGSFGFCAHNSSFFCWSMFRHRRHRRSGKNFPQVQAACPTREAARGVTQLSFLFSQSA
jgi:hypothetical protein